MAHITVPDETPSADYAVTLAQDTFIFDFTFFDQTDLRVTVNGIELQQEEFSVVGDPGYEGGYPGGTLTLNEPVADSTVRIWSDMPPARVNDFLEGTGLPARAVNTEMDRLTARMRDMLLRMQRIPVIAFALDQTLDEDDAGQIITNEGASGALTYTLPPASAGLKFGFAVVVAQDLEIAADSGETVGGASSLTASDIGAMMFIRGFDDGTWLIESQTGTWG